MTLNHITRLKMCIATVLQHPEVNLFLVMTDDVDCSWPIIGTILDEHLHLVYVSEGHCFGDCHVQGNLHRYSKLIESELSIRSNYRSCREVHSLSHEVSSNPAFFALKSAPNCFQRPSTLLFLNRLACNFIVHQGCYVVLQKISQLINDCEVGSFVHLLFEEVVAPQDCLVTISQIILRPAHTRHLD